MALPKINWNGPRKTRKVPPRRKGDTDDYLKDRTALLSSAHKLLVGPNFLPIDPDELKEIGKNLLFWVEDNPQATSIDDFFSSKRLSPLRFYKMCEGDEYLKTCLDIALSTLSVRLGKLLKDNHMYLMCNEKRYNSLEREEKAHQRLENRLKREADQKVKETVVYETISIPVITKEKEKNDNA